MRETDSSIWQKKFFTKENSIKLPYSKDNYFFAVQAVNSSGNESLIVIPSENNRKVPKFSGLFLLTFKRKDYYCFIKILRKQKSE